MKICSMCEKNKKLTDFNINKTKSSGYQSMCSDCNKEYQKKHYLENRDAYIKRKIDRRLAIREWFSEFKSVLKCEICGEDHPSTFDFHHIDPSIKEMTVSKAVYEGYSISKIKKEIEKCQVFCANCHRKHHWEERNILKDI